MAVFTAIGAAIFGAGTFLAGLTAAGLQIAAGIAINLIAKSISGSGETQASFAVQGKLQAAGDLPRSILFGYGATAGSLVYANSWGEVDKTPNAYLTQVIALADYPVASLAEVWVNGELVTLDGSPHASRGYPVIEYRKDGKDHLWIKFYDGTQLAADSFLTGTVTSAERPYSASRVGVGCPYVIATALVNDGLFSGFPAFKFAVNGAKLYDPSKDDTAGGDGDHRWSDPSTWGGDGDHLPVVQVYNLLRGITYAGDWLYGLQNLPAARLPDAHWIAQIEKCRALIAGPDGDEATYRAGGEITVNAPIADAVTAFLTASQGRLAEIGGTYKMYVGEPDAPVFSIDDEDIIVTDEQSFTPFFGLANTINGISASHPSPAEGWNSKSAPPLYNATYEAEDGNRRLMADVALDLVPYPGQVQRLMKSALAEGRRARRHTFVLPSEAFILEPGDIIEWSSERNGYESKLFRVDGIVDRANLDIMVDVTEVDPSDYDWDQGADYTTPTDGPVVRVLPSAQPMIDWAVVAEAVLDADDNARRPSMRISWDGDQPDVRAVAFEVRLASSGATQFSGEETDVAADSALLPPVFLPNTMYEVRGRYVPISQRDTDWSSWLSVTTGDIRLGIFDIDVEFDDIAAEVGVLVEWANEGTRAAIEALQQTGTLIAEQDLANFDDKRIITRELLSKTDEIVAGYLEAIEVATGPDSALAQSISTLYVSLGGNTAEANIRFFASAGPSGYASRIALQAAVDDGEYRSASLLLDVPINPLDPTRLILDATQTVITTDGGTNVEAMFDEDGAVIRDLRVGTITGPDGDSFWNLTTGAFRISGG